MDVRAEMGLIGGRLKDARLHAGMQPAEVVEAMGCVDPWFEMSPRTLANWEAGRNMPCMLQFRELCTLYGVMGYRILFGSAPLDFKRDEAAELRALMADASPALQRKVDLILALTRAPSEAEA